MIKKQYQKYMFWGITAFLVVVASVLFFFFIFRIDAVTALVGKIFTILRPILYGLIIAYLLGPIMNFWSRKLSHFLKDKIKSEKRRAGTVKGLSIFITMCIGVMIVGGLFTLVVPRLAESIRVMMDSLPGYVLTAQEQLERLAESYPEILAMSGEAYDKLAEHLASWVSKDFLPQMNNLLGGLTTGIISVFNSLFNLLIGIIVSIYVLSSKEQFVGQGKKILYALFRPQAANNILTVMRRSNRIFGGFISGKLIDSLIIGIICFAGLYMMKTPYLILVSVIIGVTNIIPFFGPYIGAIPSAVLILLVDWKKCISFVIFIVILQQVDGNIIGPKILGDSTGLSAFWVVFSILLGGGLFGFVGMLIGVPTFAVIYYLIKTFIEWQLGKKTLPKESLEYSRIDYILEEGNQLVYQSGYVEKQSALKKKLMKKDKTEAEKNEE